MEKYLEDLYGKSDYDIASELGKRFREYRIAVHLTQADVARQCGISVMTLVRFEKGKGQPLRLTNLIALMRAVQLLENMSDIIPDLPESLYEKKRKPRQRVRKRSQENFC